MALSKASGKVYSQGREDNTSLNSLANRKCFKFNFMIRKYTCFKNWHGNKSFESMDHVSGKLCRKSCKTLHHLWPPTVSVLLSALTGVLHFRTWFFAHCGFKPQNQSYVSVLRIMTKTDYNHFWFTILTTTNILQSFLQINQLKASQKQTKSSPLVKLTASNTWQKPQGALPLVTAVWQSQKTARPPALLFLE